MEDLSIWGAIGGAVSACALGWAMTRPKAPPPPAPRAPSTPDEIRARKRAHRAEKVESYAQVEFSALLRDGKTGRPKIDPDPNRSPELKAALRARMTPAEIEEFGEHVK